MAGPSDLVLDWMSPSMFSGQSVQVWIWGDSRVAANRAAFELARRLNPWYLWVDIGNPEDEVHPDDPSRSGIIPTDLRYGTVPPATLTPDNASANLATWSAVRKDEPPGVLHSLIDFLRRPNLIQ